MVGPAVHWRRLLIASCGALSLACSRQHPSQETKAQYRQLDPWPAVANACRQALPAGSSFEDDQIAALVLDHYLLAEHRAAVISRDSPSHADELIEYGVRSCAGDTVWTHRASETEREGAVHVASRIGQGWANDLRLVWLTVGVEPGLCAADRGFLALLRRSQTEALVVGLTPWEGSCQTVEHAARFVSAAGQHLILEADGDAGEDSATEQWSRVWWLAKGRLQLAGQVRTSYEETREPWPMPGFQRRMSAQIEPAVNGLKVRESWHFNAVGADRRAIERVVERVIPLESGHLRDSALPDPAP